MVARQFAVENLCAVLPSTERIRSRRQASAATPDSHFLPTSALAFPPHHGCFNQHITTSCPGTTTCGRTSAVLTSRKARLLRLRKNFTVPTIARLACHAAVRRLAVG